MEDNWQKKKKIYKKDIGKKKKTSCAKQSLPVKQMRKINQECGGGIAKSLAQAKSIPGTEIIPHSFVGLTNPGSACATSTPWDNMTALKMETGRDSKQRGPDSIEWNPCQDYL